MQKIRVIVLYSVIAASAAVLFFCTFLQVNAGYITGNEVCFTHTHGNACYSEVTQSCESSHTMQKINNTGIYHCTTCGVQTEHWETADQYNCPRLGMLWQKNGSTKCKTCGTQHSAWNQNMPGNHTYKESRLSCAVEAGEITTTFYISSEDGWTNSGVTLKANINTLKQDLTIGNINCSWEGGQLYVTENGTYSATATDALGRSLTASIDIYCIDKIPPVIKSVSADTNRMTKTSIYVNVSAEDNESGLETQAYSFDGGQNWSTSASFLLEEGKDVKLAVRDRAGNITTRSLKRSAFPYPPEPTPSPSTAPAVSAAPSGQTAEASSPSSDKTPSPTSSGKTVLQKEQAGTGGSQAAAGGILSSRKNGSADETENFDLINDEDLGEDGEGADVLSKEAMLPVIADIRQKQATIKASLQDAVFNTELGALPSIGSTPGSRNTPEALSSEENFWSLLAAYIRTHLQALLGIGLLGLSGGLFLRIVWLHSAILYCYNGGEEYRRIGLLHLKKKKQEFELYLPEYLLETKGTPRYRLMFKSRLVKKHGGEDLVVHGEDYKLRQPLEECVDFVL